MGNLHSGDDADSATDDEVGSTSRGHGAEGGGGLAIPEAPVYPRATPSDLSEVASHLAALHSEFDRASARCGQRCAQERGLRDAFTRGAERAAALRAENDQLRGRFAAASAAAKVRAGALRELEQENGQLGARCASLEGEKKRLLGIVGGLRNEVEGTRLERRMQERLQALAVEHAREEMAAGRAPGVAATDALLARIRGAAAGAQAHYQAARRDGARAAGLRREADQLERQVQQVRASTQELEARVAALDAASPAPADRWRMRAELPA